jgi:hypothetical protein
MERARRLYQLPERQADTTGLDRRLFGDLVLGRKSEKQVWVLNRSNPPSRTPGYDLRPGVSLRHGKQLSWTYLA